VTATGRAACVIGWPVEHSRSPLIHNYWLKRYRIAGEYRREAVPPEGFAAFLASLAARGYVGANVTVPHKEAALARSQPDDRARAVGAANTLWLDGATLRSTNTDVEGFLSNLDASVPRWDRDLKSAVVLGAGGAARAVIYGLITRGLERLVLVNRTRARAEVLRRQFGTRVEVAPWEELDAALAGAALLVNTTTLGMQGQPDLMVDTARLPGHAVVTDLVYAPARTRLLAAAQARRLRTADGLGMLLHQAVRGFALWFGKTPEVTPELRALLEADIASQPARP
jgi:shikimate dehydrogenase